MDRQATPNAQAGAFTRGDLTIDAMKFAIYHREREYAREMGDPRLTEVSAPTREEAKRLTAHMGPTGTLAVPLLPADPRQGTMGSGNRRSNYLCSIATTTGYFAAQNAAGITEIYSADLDKTHKIPAYGELTFWSCIGQSSATPAGHITGLICPGNHLTTLSVSGLAALNHLECAFNDLAFLRLTGLPALETLVVTKNRLAGLDVRGLSRLKTLDCYGNLLTTLDLTGRDRLQTLNCSMNHLVSLKLGGCQSLHTIYAYGNQISPLELSGLPALRDVDLGSRLSGVSKFGAAGMGADNLACHDGPLVLIEEDQAPDLAETTRSTLYAAKYVSPRARPLAPEEAAIRATAYALKRPDAQAIAEAASAMAALIGGPCWLVPVPTSSGNLIPNLTLARAIAERVPGARVKCAVTRVRPVESSCRRRLRGLLGILAADHAIVRIAGPMEPHPAYFVDNVITTGATIAACRRALGWGTGLVYADASTRHNTQPSRNLAPLHYPSATPCFHERPAP